MKLFAREIEGPGDDLVILHGLYGASDNWMSIGRELAKNFNVQLPDQRNHGHSPHHSDHSYEALAADVLEYLDDKNIDKAHIIGHSMGGKTAMNFAFRYPDRVKKLVIIDIAPKSYASFSNFAMITNDHSKILKALSNCDLSRFKNREEIDQQLQSEIKDAQLRHFLLKNVKRNHDGSFHWRINLNAITHQLETIMDGISDVPANLLPSAIPAIFVRGALSGYIQEDDDFYIRKFFPRAEIVTIDNAGHWVHAQQPDLLLKTILYFLED
jgi:pimeloyl-ACP methyl ester carboxylesterase